MAPTQTLLKFGCTEVVRFVTAAGVHGPVNSYLVETGSGRILIDPAPGLAWEAALGQPTHILATHLQAENVGGAMHFPTVPLWVPVGTEYLCQGEAAYLSRETTWQFPWDWETRGNFVGHLAGALNERPPLHPLPIAGTVEPSQVFAGLLVLGTPGHGKAALTYVLHQDGQKLGFCGDLICGDGQLWNWFDADWDYGTGAGYAALLESARALRAADLDVLLPTHGEPILEPGAALDNLIRRLEAVLTPDSLPGETNSDSPTNFREVPGPVEGWRQLSPSLYQWKTGNCALLVSESGTALLVDDGLCHWVPDAEREKHHDEVLEQMKVALGLTKIEVVLATHYHGDHTEHIPRLVEREGARCVTLDLVAEPMVHPGRYNLAASLPWYGTPSPVVPVDLAPPSGSIFSWREYEIEIFHLAGQTYYHAGFMTRVDGVRVLFAGDALHEWDTRCEPILCYNDNEPTERGWVFSLERMLERDPGFIVCGHGGVITEPRPLLEAKLEGWACQMQRYDALNPRPERRIFFDPFYW